MFGNGIRKYKVIGTAFHVLDSDSRVPAGTMHGVIYEQVVFAIVNSVPYSNVTSEDVASRHGFHSMFVGKRNPTCNIRAFEPGANHAAAYRTRTMLHMICAFLHQKC